ncbi:MAG: ABC transporter ATP-binding protein, partial [Candidatus Limnocylindria bacterium]
AEIDKRVRQAAGILGLERYLDRKPRALSGGQRQRVALGRAIVREPQVFLMDEPLSNLDAKLRVQTRAEILRLHKRLKTTIVYVTHDQVEAMTMGDRIAVMRDGVLQQVGTPQQLYAHPTNVFVAGFIGSPAMNFFKARANGPNLRVGDIQLELAGKAAEVVGTRPAGSEVTVGFRPEHLELGDEAVGPSVRLPASVDVVEFLGDQELIHAQAAGGEVLAVVSSDHRLKSGDRVEFQLGLDKLHLFDPASESALMA